MTADVKHGPESRQRVADSREHSEEDERALKADGERPARDPETVHRIVVPAGAALLASGIALQLLGVEILLSRILSGTALLVLLLPVAGEAITDFRKNPFNENVLMGTAAVVAAIIGVWPEGAAVLLVYNVAEHVEDYTVDRVRRIAERTASLLPRRALRLREGQEEDVPVEEIRPGDLLLVKSGWRVPVDGLVVRGRSSVDQSVVTGESVPVEKGPGDIVLSGTLNQEGALEVRATKPFRESTVARIVDLVTEAREGKARIERFIDRFSRIYTPSMIGVAAAIAIVPPLALGEPLSLWAYRALIALIIACPSALVISTPVITLIGLTRAMWSGALVKGGKYLEELARVRVVAFDKTGTLTYGRPKVVAVEPFNGFTEGEVLELAATAEAGSSHPLAEAIQAEAKSQGIDPVSAAGATEAAGLGVQARVGGKTVLVGGTTLCRESGVDLGCLPPGGPRPGSVVLVAVDGELAGRIVLEDRVRDDARQAVEDLKAVGIERVVMLTGDNEQAALPVARQLDVDEYRAGLLPEEKVELVRRLQEEWGSVAMVGDGVNDAPVMAASSVGIALGTAGNDVALEAADVALMTSDLRTVPYLVLLGRKVARRLRAAIGAALVVKFLLIVVGALGWIPLWVAILGDDGLTLAIVGSALPLLGFARKSGAGHRK